MRLLSISPSAVSRRYLSSVTSWNVERCHPKSIGCTRHSIIRARHLQRTASANNVVVEPSPMTDKTTWCPLPLITPTALCPIRYTRRQRGRTQGPLSSSPPDPHATSSVPRAVFPRSFTGMYGTTSFWSSRRRWVLLVPISYKVHISLCMSLNASIPDDGSSPDESSFMPSCGEKATSLTTSDLIRRRRTSGHRGRCSSGRRGYYSTTLGIPSDGGSDPGGVGVESRSHGRRHTKNIATAIRHRPFVRRSRDTVRLDREGASRCAGLTFYVGGHYHDPSAPAYARSYIWRADEETVKLDCIATKFRLRLNGLDRHMAMSRDYMADDRRVPDTTINHTIVHPRGMTGESMPPARRWRTYARSSRVADMEKCAVNARWHGADWDTKRMDNRTTYL
ncbi:hypothetical protein C8Q77DRAFT_806190 [Trametes polyzona]|nr:hypothetical protein C8Q77DRAFT_806190 [Trametes polyzona]